MKMKVAIFFVPLTLFGILCIAPAIISQESLFAVRDQGLVGYIDRSGRMVIAPQFMHGWRFSEGLACVVDGKGKAGFIDSRGKYVIGPQFNSSYGCYTKFHGGLAVVSVGQKYRDRKLINEEKWGYIDRNGKFTVLPDIEFANGFRDGLASVRKNGRMGFINTSFQTVIPFKFKSAGNFYDGRARVELMNGRRYYIDRTGKVLFSRGGEFQEGKAFVKRRGKYGFMDVNGRTIVPFIYQNANHFGNGLAGVKIGSRWGFVDEKGRLVISPQFEEVGVFAENLVAVKIKGKWGFADRTGKVVIPPQFDQWTYYFENGLCEVRIGDKAGYIDHSGKFIWPLTN